VRRSGDHDVGDRRLGRRHHRRQRPNRLAMQCKRQSRRSARAPSRRWSRAHRCRMHQDHGGHQPRIHPAARKLAELHGCELVGGSELPGCGRRSGDSPSLRVDQSALAHGGDGRVDLARGHVSAGRNRTLSGPLASMMTRRSHSLPISSSRCSRRRQAERTHQPAAADVDDQAGNSAARPSSRSSR
jgi:hypothetical protein